jgi:hypothetical protein
VTDPTAPTGPGSGRRRRSDTHGSQTDGAGDGQRDTGEHADNETGVNDAERRYGVDENPS